MPFPVKNTAYVFDVSLVSQANPNIMQANPTLAAGDVKVSTDEGAFANLATLPTVTPAAGKNVKVSLSAGEMNGDRIVVLFSDAAGAEWCDFAVFIETAASATADVNVVQISGDTAAADALETMLDGTGGNTLSLGKLVVAAATGDAVAISSAGGNGRGAVITGNGTGTGVAIGGGATAPGVNIVGGASATAHALHIQSQDAAHAIFAEATGTGIGIVGDGGGGNDGILGIGGPAGGYGIRGLGGGADAVGIIGQAAAAGAGAGIGALGGAAAGPAIQLVPGAAGKNILATFAELAQATPAAAPTSLDALLMLLYMALRNRGDVDAGALLKKFYNDAGTVITKKAITDTGAGGVYSEAEMVSGP